jgi:hypothetical protein
MMPEEWPIAASAADQNVPARPAGSGRLATVRADFFLNPAERLTEQERALMTAMLHCLVGDIADEIRAELPGGSIAANDDGHVALMDALTSARLLDEPALMALLLRRADEERIATGARARGGRREARVLQGLVSHENGGVSAAAMALVLARGRRRDRFGQCLIAFDDLPRATAEALAYAIAAALRSELSAAHGPPTSHADVMEATRRVLDRRDPARGIDELTAALVQLLDECGGLTDEFILAAAHEGEVAFIGGVLARRSHISSESAMEELLSGTPERLIALLRVAGLSRELSAGLLAGVGDLLGIVDPGQAIGVFDGMTDEEAEAARSWLKSSPAYRSSLAALGRPGRG